MDLPKKIKNWGWSVVIDKWMDGWVNDGRLPKVRLDWTNAHIYVCILEEQSDAREAVHSKQSKNVR